MTSVGESSGSLAAPATASSDSVPSESVSSATSTTAALIKFNVEKSNLLAQNKQWEELVNYLNKFVTAYHKNEFGPLPQHPGLLFAVYQAQILYHVEDNEIDEAKKLLHEMVEPLLNRDADNLYRPIDLEHRIKKLELCVSKSILLPDDELCVAKDVQMCVNDYISLYFADSIRPQVEGPSMNDFACVVEEIEGNQVIHRYRCLACHWVMPKGQSIASLGYHIMHIKNKQCPSVTIHLLRRVHDIEGIYEHIPNMNTLLSLLQKNPKKRKWDTLASGDSGSSGRPVDAQVLIMDAVSLMPLVLELGTMETLRCLHSVHCSVHGTVVSAVAAAIPIVSRQESLVANLRKMIADAARVVPAQPLRASVVLGFVDRLLAGNESMMQYLPRLPEHVRRQVGALEENLAELRLRCFSAECGYPGPLLED